MLQSTTVLINPPFTLYRSDIEKPPAKLGLIHKNKRYVDGELGCKNKEGFFFFTDSIDLANSLWSQHATNDYYLTTCEIKSPIEIIDFSMCNSVLEMVRVLTNLNINIVSDEFLMFDNKDKSLTFETLNSLIINQEHKHQKHYINHLKSNGIEMLNPDLYICNEEIYQYFKKYKDDYTQTVKKFESIEQKFHDSVTYFGQRLTDFSNGTAFIKYIKSIENDRKIDGYRFREANDERGFTYCFFNADKISKISLVKKVQNKP